MAMFYSFLYVYQRVVFFSKDGPQQTFITFISWWAPTAIASPVGGPHVVAVLAWGSTNALEMHLEIYAPQAVGGLDLDWRCLQGVSEWPQKVYSVCALKIPHISQTPKPWRLGALAGSWLRNEDCWLWWLVRSYYCSSFAWNSNSQHGAMDDFPNTCCCDVQSILFTSSW